MIRCTSVGIHVATTILIISTRPRAIAFPMLPTGQLKDLAGGPDVRSQAGGPGVASTTRPVEDNNTGDAGEARLGSMSASERYALSRAQPESGLFSSRQGFLGRQLYPDLAPSPLIMPRRSKSCNEILPRPIGWQKHLGIEPIVPRFPGCKIKVKVVQGVRPGPFMPLCAKYFQDWHPESRSYFDEICGVSRRKVALTDSALFDLTKRLRKLPAGFIADHFLMVLRHLVIGELSQMSFFQFNLYIHRAVQEVLAAFGVADAQQQSSKIVATAFCRVPSTDEPKIIRNRAYREEVQRIASRLENIRKKVMRSTPEFRKKRELERSRSRDLKQEFQIEEQAGWPFKISTIPESAPSVSQPKPEAAPSLLEKGKAMAEFAQVGLKVFGDPQNVATLTNCADSIASAASSVSVLAGNVSDFIARCTEYLNYVKVFLVKHVPIGIATALLLTFLLHVFQVHDIPPFAVTLLCTVMGAIVGNSLWERVSDIFRKDDTVSEQAGFGFSLSSLSKIVCTCMVGEVFTQKNSHFMMDSLLRRLSTFDRASTGLEGLFSNALSMAQTCLDYICGWFKWEPIRLSHKTGDKIDELFAEVHELQHLQMSNPGEQTKERLIRVLAAHREIIKFKVMFRGHPTLTRDLDSALRTCVNLSSTLKDAAGDQSGYRPMPVSICLFGEPGVGKTLMTQMFATSIFLLTKLMDAGSTEEEISNQIYVKAWNTDYFEGYFGQLMYVMDDFGLKKINPNDNSHGAFDLMTFQSMFRTLVNMAAVDNKGSTAFTSKLILMTTNMRHLDEGGLSQVFIQPRAIERRVDYHVGVRVAKDFQLGPEAEFPQTPDMLDYNKYEKALKECARAETVLDSFPWHIWEWYPTSWSGCQSEPKECRPFKELIVNIAKSVKSRQISHNETMSGIRNILGKRVDDLDALYPSPSKVQEQSGKQVETLETVRESDPEENELYQLYRAGSKKVHKHNQYFHNPFEGPCPVCQPKDHMRWVHDAEPTTGKDYFSDYRGVCCTCPGGAQTTIKHWEAGKNEEELEALYVEMFDSATKMSMFEKARHRVKKFFSSLTKAKLKWSVMAIVYNTALLGMTWYLIKAFINICRTAWEYIASFFWSKTEVEQQSNRPRGKGVKFKVQSQSGATVGNHRAIYNNSYKLGVWLSGGQMELFGQVVFLKRDYFIMPNHFRERMSEALRSGEIKGNDKILLRNCSSQAEDLSGGLTVDKFMALPTHVVKDRDIAIARLSNGCRMAKDVAKFLMSENDIKNLGGLPVRLDTARADKDGILVDYNERITFMSRSVEVGKVQIKIGNRWTNNWLRYDAATEVGDCGAPLCLQKAGGFAHRVWCGLHVGGTPNALNPKGYSTPVTSEMVETAINDLMARTSDPCKAELSFEETVEQCGLQVPKGVEVVDDPTFPFYPANADEEVSRTFGSFKALGRLTKPVSSPVETNLKLSFIGERQVFEEEFGPCDQEPMKLRPYKRGDEIVFPMVDAMRPYAGPLLHVDTDAFALAVRTAMKPFGESTLGYSGAVLSFEEAVIGVPALGLKGIPRGTSVGYPMCLEVRNKTHYFGNDDQFDLEKPECVKLKQEVIALERVLQEGKRPFFFCRGFLKDELRKIGKGSRYIAGTSIHYYILCRMYFGRIAAAQMVRFRESGMCPGINPYQDWSWLREHLLKPGGKVWDGDFKGFDTSQQPTQLFEILNYMNEWYSVRGAADSENDVRSLLFLDLAFSKHVVGRGSMATHVVQWQKSLPSGHFLTAFVNSALSMSCIVSAYIKTVGNTDFWENASAATLGDDNLVGASDDVLPVFNQITTAKHLLDYYGMEYTAGRKGEELRPYLDLSEVVFLQRRFEVKNNEVVCPLRFQSFLTNLYYTQKGDARYQKEVLVSMLEAALSELSMHPEGIWRKFSKILVGLMAELDHQPDLSWLNSTTYLSRTLARDDAGWW